jgi:NADH-quinone oxidoreductase subunit M
VILFALILVPLLSGLAIAIGPARRAREIALFGAFIALAATAYACTQFGWTPGAGIDVDRDGFQLSESVPFITALGGVEQHAASGASSSFGGVWFSVGVDSVAMLLIALTSFLGPIAVLCSWTAITERPKTFYAWLMILQAAMTGVFASRDLVLFYICFEFTLIPMWILINLYGSTNRKKAATKFFLFTFTGSVVALAALLYVAWSSSRISGAWSFDIGLLQHAAARMSRQEQALVLLGLMAGFAVKVPLFPLHTWLPLAHTEAPTAGSVILAGVLLKLGTYALYRFVLPFCPLAVMEYAPAIAVLSIIGILYGGLICWVQTDVKKLVAYSSVAHLGFCVLGLFALNNTGVTGSVLYMVNHGLSTGALFVLIGMIYERYHTRDMKQLGGLAARMPIWATFMVFFAMASVGLPGLNGFVSEFLCLLGAFQAGDQWRIEGLPGATPGHLGFWYALVAGIGMIVAAMYLLYMVGRVVWGPLVEPAGHASHAGDSHGHGAHGQSAHAADQASHEGRLPTDLNAREIGILIPLAIACLALGVYPKPILDAIQPPISRTVELVHRAAIEAPTHPIIHQTVHVEDEHAGKEGAR